MGIGKAELSDVEILHTGSFTAMNGRRVNIDKEFLRTLESNFGSTDEPQINIDHIPAGQSYGGIKSVRVEEDGDEAKLLATLHNVPGSMAAEMLGGGAYPFRSVEISPDKKLVGLAVLGAARPAVKQMQPVKRNQMSPQFAFKEPEGECEIFFQEADMPNGTEEILRLAEEKQAVETNLAAAESQRDALQAELDALKASQSSLEAENLALKEADQAKEKAIKFSEALKSADKFLSDLESNRQITPMVREAGAAHALAALDLADIKFTLPGGEEKDLGGFLRELFSMIPKSTVPPSGEDAHTDPAELSESTVDELTNIFLAGKTPEEQKAWLLKRAEIVKTPVKEDDNGGTD